MSTPEPVVGVAEDDFDPNAPIKYSDYRFDDYIALGLFWILCVDVFAQFVLRYGFNSSPAWTEEAARYLLIAVTFTGGALAVRKNTHIMVEFFYKYLHSGP